MSAFRSLCAEWALAKTEPHPLDPAVRLTEDPAGLQAIFHESVRLVVWQRGDLPEEIKSCLERSSYKNQDVNRAGMAMPRYKKMAGLSFRQSHGAPAIPMCIREDVRMLQSLHDGLFPASGDYYAEERKNIFVQNYLPTDEPASIHSRPHVDTYKKGFRSVRMGCSYTLDEFNCFGWLPKSDTLREGFKGLEQIVANYFQAFEFRGLAAAQSFKDGLNMQKVKPFDVTVHKRILIDDYENPAKREDIFKELSIHSGPDRRFTTSERNSLRISMFTP